MELAEVIFPSFNEGLGLRQSALHAPAAYVTSIVETLSLVSEVLLSDSFPSGLDQSISSLANAAHRPQWVARESIDIAIHQRLLSKCIDDVSFIHLLSSAQIVAHVIWLFHPLSPMLGTGSQLYLLLLSDYTCRTKSFDPAYNIGWEFQSMQRMVAAQFVSILQTI